MALPDTVKEPIQVAEILGGSPRRTIFAVATASGRAGVAIVRVSGPQAKAALCALAGLAAIPAPRRMVKADLRDPVSGEDLDRGLVVSFPAPGSFTGEDVAEFHIHGGRAASAAVLAALAGLPDLRPAEPGEFSRRAFEAGKLDLTAAEAIADLVAAETAAQRRQALRQLDGGLGRRYEDWRRRLIAAMARLEATIDFSEEDIPAGLERDVAEAVAGIRREISAHLDDGRRGERLREGLQIAILGAPNVGKSSLLNRLAQRDVAIVSDIAGTTRDVIEVRFDLDGYPVSIADTAGIRDSNDAVEREGVRRAMNRAAMADVHLLVLDALTWPEIPPDLARIVSKNAVVVVNKSDLRDAASRGDPENAIWVSARTGEGLDAVLNRLSRLAAERCSTGDSAPMTRARHRTALVECDEALARFSKAGESELGAEELRLAARALGRITGRVDVDDILDVVFREFCIGK